MDANALLLARASLLRDVVQSRSCRVVNVTAPSAGGEWSTVVPGGTIWQLQSIYYRFVTSAVVQNRRMGILINDGSNEVLRCHATTAESASSSARVTWISGLGSAQALAGASHAYPLPHHLYPLVPGSTLGSTTVSLDAGDQYSLIALVVRELSEWHIQTLTDYEEAQREAQPIA